jgi:hypothetical protein
MKTILGSNIEIIGPNAELIANHINDQIRGGRLMTTIESQKLIGSTALLYAGAVEETLVTITDFKLAYGVARALVKNERNGKTAWRNLDTLKINAEPSEVADGRRSD